MKPPTDLRDILIIAAIVLLTLLTVFLVTSYAQAQTAPSFRSEYNPIELHSRGHWEDDDRADLRRYVRHRRHTRKVWRHHDTDHGRRHCQAHVAVVGDQYATEEGAKEEARKSWMASARWAFGERYMPIDNAEDVTFECGRSSVGSVVGQIFMRCRLSARPCRAEPKREGQ